MTVDNVTIEQVSIVDVLHRAEEQGPRIGKVETLRVTVDGVSHLETVNHWYQWETGRLLYIQ